MTDAKVAEILEPKPDLPTGDYAMALLEVYQDGMD